MGTPDISLDSVMLAALASIGVRVPTRKPVVTARPLFNVVYCDPAWQYDNEQNGEPARGAAQYDKMPLLEMMRLPVYDLMARDSALLMWATAPKLLDALLLMYAWGCTFRTVPFVWIKANKTAKVREYMPRVTGRIMPSILIDGGLFSGPGYATNTNAEFVLLGKPRHSAIKRASKKVKQVIITPQPLNHSEKPVEAYARIEELYGAGCKYVELFARAPRDGWTTLGNGIDGRDLRESIPELITSTLKGQQP